MKPKATIIIPTHKLEKDRPGNIISLVNQLKGVLDPEVYRVIVVFNNGKLAHQITGSDRPMNMIPGTRFVTINMERNYGLSAAWNKALRYVQGEYVFFVNHDLILTREENIFEEMIKKKEFYEKKTGNRICLFGVEGTLQSPNPFPRMIKRYQAGEFGEVIHVDEVSGFLFGMDTSNLWEEYFDEKLSPCFYEEMDLCQRIRKHNGDLVSLGMDPIVNIIIPDISYRHDFGVSAVNPHSTYVSWYSSEEDKQKRETLWTINRRNKDYIEKKWGIQLA